MKVARALSVAGLPSGAVLADLDRERCGVIDGEVGRGDRSVAERRDANRRIARHDRPVRLVSPRISAAAVGSKLEPLTPTTVPGMPEVGLIVMARSSRIVTGVREPARPADDLDGPGTRGGTAGNGVLDPLSVPEPSVLRVLAAGASHPFPSGRQKVAVEAVGPVRPGKPTRSGELDLVGALARTRSHRRADR